jgi:putative SOS response-associated peptidase YedK
MCGRYTLTVSDIAALARAWAAEVDAVLLAGWRPRYNVAPGQRAPLLLGGPGQRRLVQATFGLPAPHGVLYPNARAETAGQRRAFREALRQGRAVVPADGFYEWEGPPSARRPSWFHLADGEPLLLAAVSVEGADGPAFSILTTAAVAPVARLHHRMPVILPPGALDAWLEAGPAPAIPPPSPGLLSARLVAAWVNSAQHDDPACLAPPAPPAQGSLF